MKRVIISESDRKNILRIHGLIKEDESLTTAQMLQKIQGAVGAKLQDAIIGPDTTAKIVNALQEVPKETETKFDFSCAKNNKNKKLVFDETDEKVIGYQIGELVFDKQGNYYEEKNPNNKFTYTCDGTTISTSNHGKIEQDKSTESAQQQSRIETLKKYIQRLRDIDFPDQDIINTVKEKGYTDEEIVAAGLKSSSQVQKPEEKVVSQELEKAPEESPDDTSSITI